MDGLLWIKEHFQGENESDVVADNHVCSMAFFFIEAGSSVNWMEKFGAFSCDEIRWKASKDKSSATHCYLPVTVMLVGSKLKSLLLSMML